MNPLKVLIVDDDSTIRSFMKLRLTRTAPHFSVSTASSAQECLSYLKKHDVDCVLSDYLLVGMDGLTLLGSIKELGYDVPVIFVTGQGNENVAREAFKGGAYDYFTKEAGFAHFTRIVNSIERAAKKRASDAALRRYSRQVETLTNSSRDINRVLEVPAVMRSLITSAMDLVGAKMGAAGIMEEGRMVFTEYTRRGRFVPFKYSFDMDNGVPGHVMRTMKTYISNDAPADPHVNKILQAKFKYSRLINVPIISRTGDLLGCLQVHDKKDDSPFDESDAHVLEGLAASASVALENSTMLEEQRRVETLLRESEQRFSLLVDNAAEAIYLHDLKGRFVGVNQRACEDTGYSRGELLNMSVDDLDIGYDKKKVVALWKTIKEGNYVSVEGVHRRKDGSTFPVEVGLGKTESAGQKVIIATVRDVTAQRDAFEATRTKADYQAEVASLGQLALSERDLGSIIDKTVNTIRRTLGVEFAKVLELQPGDRELLLTGGVGWKKGLVGEAIVKADRKTQAGYTLLSKKPVIVADFASEKRFGSPPLLKMHGVRSGMSVVIHGRERPYGILGAHSASVKKFTAQDVSFLQTVANVLASAVERARSENAIRMQRDYLDAVVETAHALICVLDAEGRIVGFNKECEHVTGYTQQEALGRTPWEFLLPKSAHGEVSAVFKKLLAGRAPANYQNPWLTKSGEARLIDWSNSFIKGQDGKVRYVIATGVDVTESKAAERAVRHSNERLAMLNRIDRAMLSNLDLDGVLETLLRDLTKSCSMESGCFFQYDSNDGKLIQMKSLGAMADGEVCFYLRNLSLLENAVREQKPAVVSRTRKNSTLFKRFGILSIAVLPLVSGGKVRGVITLCNKNAYHDFTDDETSFAVQVADQASVAIDNARLVSKLKSNEEDLKRHNTELSAINSISKIIEGKGSLERKLQLVLDKTLSIPILEVEKKGAIFLLDVLDPTRLVMTAHTGLSPGLLSSEKTIKIGHCLCGKAAETGEVIISTDCFKDPHHTVRYKGMQSHGHIVVPIKSKKKVQGVMTFYLTPGTRSTRADLDLLGSIAQQVGMAVENSQLFANVAAGKKEWEETFDAMEEMVTIHAPDYTILRANKAAARLSGKKIKGVIGRKCHEVFHGSDSPSPLCPAVEMMKTAQSYTSTTISSGDREFEFNVYPVRHNGRMTAFVHVVKDVTERNRVEKAIKESERKYRSLIENANDAIFIANANTGVILDANKKAEELIGIPAKEIVGMNQAQLHPPENPEIYKEHFKESVRMNGSANKELTVRHRDGRDIPVEISASVLELAGGKIIQGIFRDITARKQSEEALRLEAAVSGALLEASQITGAYLDWDEVVDKILPLVHRLIESKTAEVLRLEEDGTLFPQKEVGHAYETASLFYSMRPKLDEVPGLEKAASLKKAAMFGPAELEKNFPEYLINSFGLEALIAVPVVFREKVFGFLTANFASLPSDPRVVDILSGIAGQLGVAFDNSSLYSETMEKSLSLARKVETLNVLYEIDRMILSTLNREDMLSRALMQIKRLLPADAGGIVLSEPGGQNCRFGYGWGLDIKKNEPIDKKDCPASKILQTGKPLVRVNIDAEKLSSRLDLAASAAGVKSDIYMPIMSKGTGMGMLYLGSHRVAGFTVEDVEIAGKLANQISIALENTKLVSDLEDMLVNIVKALASAIDAKSPWTKGHSERVTDYAVKIAVSMGLSETETEKLRLAGLLHDIGKIGTYDSILDKPGKLTDEEFALIRQHPGKGGEILAPIKQLHEIIPAIRHHHERWDGRGYPAGLKGEDIPPMARILCVADSFDSMTADRPYRPSPGIDYAIEEFGRCAGSQFDPEVVKVFLEILKRDRQNPPKT